MALNDQRIEPLPSEVVAKLKSSTSITHLNGVVVELVKNALDANAHTVYVTTDFHRGGCVIDDDGHGILPTEFYPDGGLGKPYRMCDTSLSDACAHLLIHRQILQGCTRNERCMVSEALSWLHWPLSRY